MRPKMGKIDIDYQRLHDAFFRFQTKPKFTIHGDLYYDGKVGRPPTPSTRPMQTPSFSLHPPYASAVLMRQEFETKMRQKKPGDLSEELKIALGMPVGPVRLLAPSLASSAPTISLVSLLLPSQC